METLLWGVVGSTAYGLSVTGSDVDHLSMFARPTRHLLGLTSPAETLVFHDPDHTAHEAAKFLRLTLKCNPTATELLWLPEYGLCAPLGLELVKLRLALLSAPLVRAAYLGYAKAQFRKLENRGGTFDSDIPERRTAKHARHLYRLCIQGLSLYRDAELPILLDNPDEVMDFGDTVASGGIDLAREMLAEFTAQFDAAKPAIRENPDLAAAEAWLAKVRDHYYREV